MYDVRRRSLVVGIFAFLAIGVFGQAPQGARSIPFTHDNRSGWMDDYPTLFFGSTAKDTRRKLFELYLSSSPEGQARVKGAGPQASANAAVVWRTLTIVEQTTFLAITTALGAVEAPAGFSLLDWIDRLEEIHGEARYPSGQKFDDNQAFRLYARLKPSAIAELQGGRTTFRNRCNGQTYNYGTLGGFRHPDYCAPGRFRRSRKTDNSPNIQFNFTAGSGCADIDLDYYGVWSPSHPTRDNSNVLAGGHTLNKFVPAYCDPGFTY